MDEADQAQAAIEHHLAVAVANARANTKAPQRTGSCLNCDERFPAGDTRVFCDADCGEDHEKRLRRR